MARHGEVGAESVRNVCGVVWRGCESASFRGRRCVWSLGAREERPATGLEGRSAEGMRLQAFQGRPGCVTLRRASDSDPSGRWGRGTRPASAGAGRGRLPNTTRPDRDNTRPLKARQRGWLALRGYPPPPPPPAPPPPPTHPSIRTTRERCHDERCHNRLLCLPNNRKNVCSGCCPRPQQKRCPAAAVCNAPDTPLPALPALPLWLPGPAAQRHVEGRVDNTYNVRRDCMQSMMQGKVVDWGGTHLVRRREQKLGGEWRKRIQLVPGE